MFNGRFLLNDKKSWLSDLKQSQDSKFVFQLREHCTVERPRKRWREQI